MHIRRTLLAGAAVLTLMGGQAIAQDRITLNWWHAMGGANNERVNQIAAAFNDTQDKYEVVALNRGSYAETMNAAIAAFRAGEQPHIVQVFEVGTRTMMSAGGAIKPVFELMEEAGRAFDPNDFLPAVTGYYTNDEGKMLSFPFNSSTPVLYYNKDAFRVAGLDPDSPPKTWTEVGEMMTKVVSSGAAACGFTTAWPSWVQLENFSARHDQSFATMGNGFGGLDTELAFNGAAQVRHLKQLAAWQTSGVFKYGGRRNVAGPLFTGGECAMYTESSAGLSGIRANAQFDFGVAQLPYWKDTISDPKNTIIGGASLWVLSGHEDEEYAGVAEFFDFMSSSGLQAAWHQASGYLPITPAAFTVSKISGYYERNPGADISIFQMSTGVPTGNSKGLRLGSFVQIRDVIEEEMEAVLAGQKTAQAGLDEAVERGNVLLRKFERANK